MSNPISEQELKKRLADLCVNSRITAMPGRARGRAILLMSVVATLDWTRDYSEADINDELRSWPRDVAPSLEMDHVHLRRVLVDEGFLTRRTDGSEYAAAIPSGRFSEAVPELDIYETLGAARRERRERKQRYAPS